MRAKATELRVLLWAYDAYSRLMGKMQSQEYGNSFIGLCTGGGRKLMGKLIKLISHD